LIQNIPFFKERGIQGQTLLDLVACMSFKTVKKDVYVVEYGDVGDEFYLILDGAVEVQIPDKRKQT
jgi:CRP-like cAMP-binding protein